MTSFDAEPLICILIASDGVKAGRCSLASDEKSLETFDEDCQFLPFRSHFSSLRQLFESVESIDETHNLQRQSWYVGFCNCQPILDDLRKNYPLPHFLPEEAEIPNSDYISASIKEQ